MPPPPGAAKSEYSRALDSLTRYLALRDHSKFELRTRLGRKYPPELIDRLLNEAEENGWLAPEDQIAERLALALARRHKSQMYIEGQLRARGLPVKVAGSELESARHLVERKFGPGPWAGEDKEKASRFLKNRGFQEDAITQVLNEER